MKIKKINIPAMKIIILLLFSLILSAVVVLGRKFVYSGLIFGSVNDNYIKEFSTGDLLYIILGMIIIGIVIALIAMIYKYLDKKIEISRITIIPKKRRKYILICGIIIFIFWIPYLLNYMPGCIYSDGFNSIGQALYGGYNNHHPILYTLYVKIFIDIGQKFNDLKIGILLYSIMQMVIMSIIMGYFVIWILEQCSSKIYAFLILLFICLNPLFPYYAITLWKDTLFSLALFLYVLMHIDIVQSNGMILTKWKMIIKYCLISLAVAFLRNNGIYIIIFTDVVLIFSFRKLLKTKLKMFLKAVVSMIVMIVIIQGPVYKSLGLTTEFCESVGIPLQQLARTVVCGGEYSAEDGSFINEICSLDYIKEKYTPCIVDSIK